MPFPVLTAAIFYRDLLDILKWKVLSAKESIIVNIFKDCFQQEKADIELLAGGSVQPEPHIG